MGQQHDREPAQPTGFDEVAVRGAHRITIDAACLYLGSPPPLESVIEADHNRAIRHKGADEQT
jgi:hypothetical protein